MRRLLWLLPLIPLLAACGGNPVSPELPEPPPAITEPQLPPTAEEPEAPVAPETPTPDAPPAEELPAEPEVVEPPAEEPGPIPGLVSLVAPTPETEAKILHDEAAGTVTIDQQDQTANPPIVEFVRNGYILEGENWSLSGKMTTDITYNSCSMTFRCGEDEKNFAEFIIQRKQSGTCSVYRNITRNGTRLQTTANEQVLKSLQNNADWPIDFHLLVCDGWLYFFLQEPGEEMMLVTSYAVDWTTSAPQLQLTKNARVTFSDLSMSNHPDSVRSLYQSIAVTGEVKGSAKVLFLGNSGIYFYDTPNTFSRIARQAGYLVEVNTIARGSAYLHMFASSSTDYLAELTQHELKKGYDRVYLQEATSCINSETKGNNTKLAVRDLNKSIQKAGSKTVLYVRAPMNNYTGGRNPLIAGQQYDELFTPLGQELNSEYCYVNRAFALAYKELDINLWHSDDAHQNDKGTYLAACVLFSSLFDTSCQVLPNDCLSAEEAQALRNIADRVVLEGVIPW